jgi:hypothetical protein
VLPKRRHLVLPEQPIREAASYRHRGICIEGYPRLDHVLGLLDWMAKRKMNAFQLQFRLAGAFWRRGYEESPEVAATASQKLTVADYAALDDQVIAHAKKLGMAIHRVGHGWTAMALGYPVTDWHEPPDHPLPREKREWPALVDGSRGFFRNQPGNTELCLSNPEVREAFIREVVTYAARHPEVDVLHVWLSDAINNNCECADCRRKAVTDLYLEVIGEIGRRMKAQGLPTQVVFLAYWDTLWPPATVRFKEDNLIFMLAPPWRCYQHHLNDNVCGDAPPTRRPRLNRLPMLSRNRIAVSIARKWKKLSPPDSFLFDYYGHASVWQDGLKTDLGTVVAQDVKALSSFGLDGLISCQCIRCFYPTPVFMNAMADLLWRKDTPARAHREKVLAAAFGLHAGEAQAYLAQLLELTGDRRNAHAPVFALAPAEDSRAAKAAVIAAGALRRFRTLARTTDDAVVRTSFGVLAAHAEHVWHVARAFHAGGRGDAKELARLRQSFERRLPQILREFSPWIDAKFAEPVWTAMVEAEEAIARVRRGETPIPARRCNKSSP